MANATQSERPVQDARRIPQSQAPTPARALEIDADAFILPASLEQTRYWMLSRLDPTSTASNMAISFEIHGELEESAVEATLAALTLRHEALRTLFKLEGGTLSQVITEKPLYRFTVEDFSALPEAAQTDVLESCVSRQSHIVIDLERGPVLHAHLVHLNRQKHVLALTLHHIVCDGWSNGLLVRDFTLLYENIRVGKAPIDGLPALPFQFADFALWQSEYLASPAADEAAAFWRAQLTGDLCALDIPTDQPRTAGRSFPGHIESALLPQSTSDLLSAYCRRTGSTKHIVLLAAFEALCSIYSGQKQFLLGSTTANRTQPGMEDVVGRFANPQIIVAHVDGDPTFAELEERVRRWETTAYQYQDLPFSRVIEDFQLDQAGATSQFLQIWFLYQKAFMQPQAGETIRLTPRRSVSGGVDFDLLVSIVERAEGPRIQCEYNTMLFAPTRIQALINHFMRLLDEALRDPSLKLSQLGRALAPLGAELAVPVPSAARPSATQAATLLSVIAHHRATRPDDIAIADSRAGCTWRTLCDRSNALAVAFKNKFPQATAVAVVLTPQVESAIALLAAIRLGIDIVPLPAQTTADAAVACLSRFPHAVLLGPDESSSHASLAFASFLSLVDSGVDSGAPATKELPCGRFFFLTDADSGSFDEVSADAVFKRIVAALPHLNLGINHKGPDASILCFPASTPTAACFDLLTALISGAQLTLAELSLSSNLVEALTTLTTEYQPDYLFVTPATAKAIAHAGWPGDRRLHLVVRGAALPAPLSSFLTFRLKNATYVLLSSPLGGPIAFETLTGARAAQGMLSLSDTISLFVTDTGGHPLPPGAHGELRLRNQQGKMYSTGLMAQSTPAGTIHRADGCERMVQLRGHRIYLGDVEDAALVLPSIREAAATVFETAGEARLTLYVVASSHAEDEAVLRGNLSQTLPSYLVPSDLILVDALTFRPDGRLDLDHLKERESAASRTPADSTQHPWNEVEQKLAVIWKDVLNLKSLDADSSFFDLGGSSLLLVRLFARINKTFDTALPITTIFDAPTLSTLARMLGGEPHISHLVQVQPSGSRRPLFMIHSYLLYQGLSMSLGADQPFYGLRELEEDGQLNIEQRVQTYVAEIRKVQPQGPYSLAGWCAAAPLTVEVARQFIQSGERVNYLALFDAWLPGYVESLEAARRNDSWLHYKGSGGRFAYHRNKLHGLSSHKKLSYGWMLLWRMIKESRDRFYLSNWLRLHRLAQRYHFSLPQFMHNTSYETFSALQQYQGRRVPVRITLIRATEAREIAGATASCGWEQIAELGVDVLWAPGDHETMFTGDRLKVTSEIVRRGLEAAESPEHYKGIAPGNAAGANQMLGVLHVDCPS